MNVTRLLVANRGEIARRIIRAATAMGIRTVAVFVDEDESAPYVREADEAVRLPTTYLDVAAIVGIARVAGADAVHPGYGFGSENAGFAATITDAGLTWVGPPPEVIAAMGDKLAAKQAAIAAGVPTLAMVDDPACAGEIGYPLLVKAAAGGGGKGMRVVRRASDLDDAVTAARREAFGAFGDDRIYLEQYLESSRHVEIQVLGDRHGNLVHLGERECSIQRRHQKLIEESPSPFVMADDARRDTMGEAALRLCRSIGYESAGTVEFLVDDVTGVFYFLEVNARLQVEHPVTEAVTGIDLVREQIRIAAGEELGYDQSTVRFHGHAIEARLCAEDPEAGFLPATGTLVAFEPAATPVARWESGVEAGTKVGATFDPMLGKVIAHAATRSEAASVLALALDRLHLGGVTTNRDFLVATLRHERFLAGDTTTDFIERVQPAALAAFDDAVLERGAIVAALWIEGEQRAAAPVLGSLPSGWRNARLPAQRTSMRHGDRVRDVTYRAQRDGSFLVGSGSTARVHGRSATDIDVEIDGRRATARVTHARDHVYVQCGSGTIDFVVVPRFVVPSDESGGSPGGLRAPMPGVVLEVRAAVGDTVVAGDTLVVLEAMKMEHHIGAPADGVVREVFVSVGDQVDTGAALLDIDTDELTDAPDPGSGSAVEAPATDEGAAADAAERTQ